MLEAKPVAPTRAAIFATGSVSLSSIAGTVYLGSTTAPAGTVVVTATDYVSAATWSATVDGAGHFVFFGIPSNDQISLYYAYTGPGGYQSTYYGQVPNSPYAWNWGLASSYASSGANQVLTNTLGAISGRVTLGSTASPAAAGQVTISYISASWDSASPYAPGVIGSATFTTDANGDYSIPNLVPGYYVLHYVYSGNNAYQSQYSGGSYFRIHSVPFDVQAGGSTSENITLPPTGTLSGKVYLGSNSTPAGPGTVTVQLRARSDDDGSIITTTPVTTDANGNFTVTGLNTIAYSPYYIYVGTGSYQLGALPNYGTTYTGGGAEVFPDFTLPVAYTMSGHIYLGDSSHSASSGQVLLRFALIGSTQVAPVTAYTDANGNFLASGLAAGSYAVSASVVGSSPYGNQSLTFDPSCGRNCGLVVTGDRSGLTATLVAGNSVSGRVVDDTGAPVAGVQVAAIGMPPSLTEEGSTTTAADGTYSLNGLPDGSYQVAYNDPSYAPAYYGTVPGQSPQTVTVANQEQLTGINETMHLASIITGTVLMPGGLQSLQDVTSGDVAASLQVLDTASNTWVSASSTAGIGYAGSGYSYEFANLQPGQYRVTVHDASTQLTVDAQSGVLTLGAGATDTYNAVITGLAATSAIVVVDNVAGSSAGISLSGYAVWPSSPTTSVNLAINVGANWYGVTANQPSAEGAELQPGSGADHGFSTVVPLPPGTYTACVWVSEPTGGAVNTGCHTVVVPARPATTYGLDSLSGSTAGVSVAGWAQFPDAPSTAVNVAVNIGAGWYGFTANQANTDAGAGTNHGYSGTIPLAPGTYSACVWVSEPTGGAVNTGCHTVVVPARPATTYGLDSLTGAVGGVSVAGWAQFPDAPSSAVNVAVNIGAGWYGFTANQANSDAGAGTNHGYSGTIPIAAGTYTACVWVSEPTGGAVNTGCHTVVVPARPATTYGLDSLTGAVGGVSVAGWAQFPDAPSSAVNVAVNIGAGWYGFTANQANSDAGAGTNHGYSGTIPIAAGTYTACVWVSEPTGAAVNTGCHTVVVPAIALAMAAFQSAAPVPGGIQVTGYSEFPSATSTSVVVAAQIGASWFGFTANGANTTVPGHGFSGTIPETTGTYTVCMWTSEPNGPATQFGCKSVTIP